MLNARWPERYRRHDEDRTKAAKESLDTLKQMARDWKKRLEAGAVEGELSEDVGKLRAGSACKPC